MTSTRRRENLSRVPVNITVFTQRKMDAQAVRSIEDIARLTPDVTFNAPEGPVGGFNSISIRGIDSSAGAPTTGVYIDDTPVQARSLLYTASTGYPEIFDLERVEILRGPQGTLFGAGAEGGALRFITPQPDLFKYSGYARGEVADTVGGAPSYESGLAYGGPIINGVLGFRASVFGRRDGGYIDRVSPDTGGVVAGNTNYQNTGAYKFALTYKPFESLTITPSFFYQDIYRHDKSLYWENISRPYSGDFKTAFRQGEPGDDKFILPALRIDFDGGRYRIISNTSLYNRSESDIFDDTNYISDLFFGSPYVFAPGDKTSPEINGNKQSNLTQELRVQSNPGSKWVDWVFGVFYARDIQSAIENNVNGSQVVAEELGPLVDGIYGETLYARTRDEQVAGFGNLDIHVTSKLKAQLGLRVARDNFSYAETGDGPINQGFSTYNGSESETPVTPKFGLSYQVDRNNMLYFSASKGYRTGGAQEPVPASFCSSDLKGLGLANSPTSYASDNVWSYEVGSKNRLFGGRLTLDSSLYRIDWNNIQQRVTLPFCGFGYVTNLGSATSQGVDVAATLLLARGLRLGGSLGYDDVKLDQTEYAGADVLLAKKGDHIGGAPFVATISGDYEFSLNSMLQGYGHFDYTFRSRSPSVNAQAYTYDPEIEGEAANDFLTMRVGVRYKQWDLSAFAKNLTNDVKTLQREHDYVGAPLFYNTSYRPLTVGVTVTSHF